MRTVTAPDGREWKVGRQWLPRRVRFRDDLIDVPSVGDVGFLDDVGGLLVGIAVVLLVLAALVFVIPVIVLALEVLLVLLLLMGGLAGRLLLGKPWHVLARSGDQAYRWPVKGWRASGERVDEVAGALASGSLPPGAQLLKQ